MHRSVIASFWIGSIGWDVVGADLILFSISCKISSNSSFDILKYWWCFSGSGKSRICITRFENSPKTSLSRFKGRIAHRRCRLFFFKSTNLAALIRWQTIISLFFSFKFFGTIFGPILPLKSKKHSANARQFFDNNIRQQTVFKNCVLLILL